MSFGDIAPQLEVFAAGLAAGRGQLVWTRIVADTETPVGAMLKLGGTQNGGFLLESVEGGAVRGRYSLLGLDPDLVWRATGDRAEINRDWRRDPAAFEPLGRGALAELRTLAAAARADVPPELPAALACLVGYMGYETARLVEPTVPAAPPSPLGLPDMFFVRPGLLLVFDRLRDELFIVAPVFPDTPAAADPARAHAEAVERIETVQARLVRPLPAGREHSAELPDGDVTPALDPARYAAMVDRAKDYIFAGDIFQVVLAQRFSVDFPLPPIDLYRALRRINPSPFL